MSADAVIGVLIALVTGLVGVVYGMLRSEDKRHARNIHELRNTVHEIIMALAARGIRIRDDE